ncbi:MAG: translation elongation factor 4, partial [Oscillospiraceae bacterium]
MPDRRKNIRNFCIIAHIDHGKSTLADRILEKTSTVALRDMEEQFLDNMDLERERGITIKARAVRADYKASDGEIYHFNLIDTPGHVDFNYEVSRSLAACEGALLVVDASQGIEAQTLANTYLAIDHDLEIIPVINKIDLPSADPEKVCHEIEDIIGIPAMDAPRVSAKSGINIEEVLERIVRDIPPPTGDENAPLRALIFDSFYDTYRGVIVYIRMIDGIIKAGDTIRMMAKGAEFTVVEVGYMGAAAPIPASQLLPGEVGYIAASIKNVSDTSVGDTVTNALNPAEKALPGYMKVNPMVFSGVYPVDGAKYADLRDALEKLRLNDASLSFEPETSKALGFGFRCGFLGLLHMEIIQERLEREFNLELITTAPSVIYKLHMTNGETIMIDNPTNYPDPALIASCEEPYVKASIFTPTQYIGTIMELCQERRGTYKDTKYLDADRAELHYDLPLNEIIYDFFDSLKSRTKGYAS